MPPTRRTTSTSENKPPRKRNVTSRGRTGCLTCRRRRLKCDETKPGCNNCRRINVQCEGYAQKITFKDQTNLTVERAKGNPTASRKKSQSSSVEAIGDDASKTSSTDGNQQSTPDQFIDYMVDLESSNSLDITRYGSIDANLEEVQGQITPPTTYHDIVSPVMATSKKTGYMTPRSPVSLDLCPSPPRVLPNASLGLAGAFEFPEDYTYFEYSAGGGLSSISRVLPLAELFQSESVSSHVYNAALALSALSLSTNNPVSHSTGTGSITLRRHAFHHSLKAIQGLQHELAQTQKLGSSSSNSSLRADSALSLFATIMLAANFELQRGSIPSWRSHMRGAASCLNATYAELTKKATGMLLIRAFARMALLLRLYNESYSVTTAEYMQPQLVNWLNRLLRESSRLHDRILLLVEEVTALEIQKRLHPELEDSTWSAKSADLLRRVEEWRNDLPPSDIPVDDNTSGTYLTISSQDMSTTNSSLLPIPPLHFPHSQDPCITAVNYASYLCIRMRALTRYSTSKTIHPQDTEQNALTICRIAAAHPPSHFGSSFTYSYGMLPSVVGAYRWSSNPGLRAWAKHWLTGYRTTREGIWDVTHTLRLIKLMDERVHPAERGRGEVFVAARTVDEPDEPEDELGIAEGGSGRKPFKIVLRTRGMGGSSSSVVMVN